MILQEGIEKDIEKGVELEKKKAVLRGFDNGVSVEILALITSLSDDEVKGIIENAQERQ